MTCECPGTVHRSDCWMLQLPKEPVTASALSSNLVYINQVSTNEVWVSSDEED